MAPGCLDEHRPYATGDPTLTTFRYFAHGAQVRGALRQERPGDPADQGRADRDRTRGRRKLGVAGPGVVELRSSAGPLVHIRYTARPASAALATLIAMADTDEVIRLRLLRAIRDLL
jgi:hypothetical protein